MSIVRIILDNLYKPSKQCLTDNKAIVYVNYYYVAIISTLL